MMGKVIEVNNLTKKFKKYSGANYSLKATLLGKGRKVTEQFTVLNKINFSLIEGEVLGIVGTNGSGKSTLLKLIAGILIPDEGMLNVRGRLSAILELGAGFHPEYSGYENIFLNGALLGMSRYQLNRLLEPIIDFSELGGFIFSPVKNYSSGMYARLAFSIAIHVEPQILVLDEVLSVGDEAFQQKCIKRIESMASIGTTIIFVSHDSHLVNRLGRRAIYLSDGKIILDGDPETVLLRYHNDLENNAIVVGG